MKLPCCVLFACVLLLFSRIDRACSFELEPLHEPLNEQLNEQLNDVALDNFYIDAELLESAEFASLHDSVEASSSSLLYDSSPAKRVSRGKQRRGPVIFPKNNATKVRRPEPLTRPVKPAADRLTAASNQEKWQRFLSKHPKYAKKPSAELAKLKQQFIENRQNIVKHNDKANKLIFKSSGPFAAMSPAQFQQRVLIAKKPKKYNNVPAPAISLDLTVPKKTSASKAAPAPPAQIANSKIAAKKASKKSSATTTKTAAPAAALTPRTASSTTTRSKSGKSKSGKRSKSLLQMYAHMLQPAGGGQAGGQAGAAGGQGAIAGSKGGAAGGQGAIAGSKGGDAGGQGAIAGSKGGDAGGQGAIAGSKGGSGSGSPFASKDAKGYGSTSCSGLRTWLTTWMSQNADWAYSGSDLWKPYQANIDKNKFTKESYMAVADKCSAYLINLISYCGGKDPSGQNPCGTGNQLPPSQTIGQKLVSFGADSEMLKIATEFVKSMVDRCGLGYLTTSLANAPIDIGGEITPARFNDWLLKLGVPQKNIDQLITISKEDRQSLLGFHVGEGQVNEFCGSCWSHTVMYALTQYRRYVDPATTCPCTAGDSYCESDYQRAHGQFFEPTDFSPQQILNCVKSTVSQGCTGGSPMEALDWLKTNPIGLIDQFPLTPTPGACVPAAKSPAPSGRIMSWGWSMIAPACTNTICPKQGLAEYNMVKNILSGGGVMIAYVDASNWQFYRNGKFPINLCSNDPQKGNHVVVVSALIQDENGVPTWVIANSWGSSWGNGGMIWLPFGVNACGIANFVIQANPPPEKAPYDAREKARHQAWLASQGRR